MNTPNRLKAAEDRLNHAIGRLEAAVRARPHAQSGDSQDTSDLRAQIDALGAENQELRTVLGGTAERLDGTIAKFKAKLDA